MSRDKLREEIARLEEQRRHDAIRVAWDEDESTHPQIFVSPGGIVHVGETGRHRAVQVPDSQKISGAAAAVTAVIKAVNNPYALAALALLVGAFIAWLRLK